MEAWGWISKNWLEMLNALGIVGGLFFTAVSLRSDTKTQRVANLLTITSNHRDIWKEFSRRPELKRVLDVNANVASQPITPAEREFVNFVILHMGTVFYAMQDEIVVQFQGLRRDASSFFSLPIPLEIWNEMKAFQNDDFVAFVEGNYSGGFCFFQPVVRIVWPRIEPCGRP